MCPTVAVAVAMNLCGVVLPKSRRYFPIWNFAPTGWRLAPPLLLLFLLMAQLFLIVRMILLPRLVPQNQREAWPWPWQFNAGNSSSAYYEVDERVSARHAVALADERWRLLCRVGTREERTST